MTVDQNNDMRKIAAWAGIAAVWTAFAGIYGMNFEHMPELSWQYGYPVAVDAAAGHLGAALPRVPPQRLALTAVPHRPPRIDRRP